MNDDDDDDDDDNNDHVSQVTKPAVHGGCC